MPRKRCSIHIQILKINRRLSQCLRCIRVKERTTLVGNLRKLFDGLDAANFTVRHHNGNQHGIIAHRLPQGSGSYKPVGIHRQIRDRNAFALQAVRRRQHRIVLNGGYDNVATPMNTALLALLQCSARQAEQGGIIGFRSARREDNLGRTLCM